MFVLYSVIVLILLAGLFFLWGIRWVPNTRIGIVEKLWSYQKGSVRNGLIALSDEAGFQPELLRGGYHWLMPFQYRVHRMPLITIPQGKIGYVFARDGKPLGATQTLASNALTGEFEDAAAFLNNGGQRGPQRKILREGTYAINLGLFVVITDQIVYFLPLHKGEAAEFDAMADLIQKRGGFEPVVIKGTQDQIGIVTVHDGPALQVDAIIAPMAGNNANDPRTYHNGFQDPERFLLAGGRRGRQLQVLVDGTYYINRLFATVEMIPKTLVPVGQVGVVISYTGETGIDLSGADYKHGELVAKGQRGVWSEALLPGKYAFNLYAGEVVMVPTTNFILKWIRSETGSHRFDENLCEVSLITKDAFEPSLPLSVVVHIDYRKAPLVIQRFGDIRRLVEQTLDPMVSAYFKNVGQTRTLIQLLQDRSAIQLQAGTEMKEKFMHYNLELEEVLIGTPASSSVDNRIEEILTQLRSRQIAEEQVETYARMERAATQERQLREAQAHAKQQESLTQSELSIQVQTNQGKAEYQRALQQAAQIRAMAEAEAGRIGALAGAEAQKLSVMAGAEAQRIRVLSEAEASRTKVTADADAEKAARVGIAQAMAVEEQVRAYGGPQFQLTQQVMSRFAEAIQQSGVDIVPKIVIGGGSAQGTTNGTGQTGGGLGGNAMDALMAMLLSEKLNQTLGKEIPPSSPEAQAIRDQIRAQLTVKPKKAA
ncbi:MAG TPA: SPFH domain-containing protein [Planctomycetota bacterium]|nr:SPFH domain-containing protein [Planctomycetota bacterium]